MPCHYCGYGKGGHNAACPESMSGDAKAQAWKDWRTGYAQGSSGEDETPMQGATYHVGWLSGVVALEERENGHDPRFDNGEFVNVSADPVAYDDYDDWGDNLASRRGGYNF